ncbi:hypothetical protein ACKWTF_004356 [Chironomus riparius]
MNIIEKFILVLIASQIFTFKAVLSVCQVNLSTLSTSSAKEPLFLTGTSNDHLNFKIPRNGLLQFDNEEFLHVYCPNTALFSTRCKDGMFNPIHNLNCPNSQSPDARSIGPNADCGPKDGNTFLGRQYQIGYQVPNLRFLNLTTICRNDNTDSTYYVKHNLYAGNIDESMDPKRFTQ